MNRLRQLIRGMMASLRNYKTLSFGFGQYRTMWKWSCIDKDGQPLPWYTYPSIEYIKQLDLTDKTVFEYGSGNSSLFWAQRCRHLVAVEDDAEWYHKIKENLPSHVDYLLIPEKDAYIAAIEKQEQMFDIIIIDGSHRYHCAAAAIKKLKKDGFIILDNSDWREKSAELLRKADLIEVDMSGFGPINGYTWTTSFFFTRQVQLKPAHSRQPIHSIGSVPNNEVIN